MKTTQRDRVQRAAESSPGRKPGVTRTPHSISPFRGGRGSVCRPRRGLRNIFVLLNPGLTPGATDCRRFRRLVDAGYPRAYLIALWPRFLLFSFFLFPFAFVS